MARNKYSETQRNVSELLNRNKRRLLKEIEQSKELFKLLQQSVTRKLTKEEQEYVHNQLLDIFKTIPSLAIFMLPGGAILLPIVVKFIPSILPSAFRDEEE